jgi:hypothetical protein
MKRYEVMNVQTRECFGNHTHSEAVRRAQIMRRNWNYSANFVVVEMAEIRRDDRIVAESHRVARS